MNQNLQKQIKNAVMQGVNLGFDICDIDTSEEDHSIIQDLNTKKPEFKILELDINIVIEKYLEEDDMACKEVIKFFCDLKDETDIKKYIGLYDVSKIDEYLNLLIEKNDLPEDELNFEYGGDGSTWWTVTSFKLFVFKLCSDFGYDINLNWLDVSSVTDMDFLFGYLDDSYFPAPGELSIQAEFNPNISYWDVSNVDTMIGMFFGNSKFDGDLSQWDVSHVRSFAWMFNDANKVNFDISQWKISQKRISWQHWDCEEDDGADGCWCSMQGMLGGSDIEIPSWWNLDEEQEEVITSTDWPIGH